MALLSTNSRTAVPQAFCVPNSSGRAIRNSRNSGSSIGSPRQFVLLTAQALRCSFSGRSVSAGPGGCSGRIIPKLSHRAQYSPTAKRSTGAVYSMAVQVVNCSSEAEPLVGQVSAPARAARGFIASLLTAVGGLLGSAGSSGRGDIHEGGGGGGGREAAGEGKVGAVKDLLRVGCALVTPGVGGAAASSSGHWWSPYVPGMADIFAGVVTMGTALALLQVFNELAKRDVLDRKLSRKLLHIGVGLVFMLCWPLFTSSIIAPYLAAFAPGINAIRLLFIGLGWMNDDAFVRSMTRDGDRRELIKGPFYYGVAVVVTTLGFWRTSPVGIVALVNLCAGDGFADIIGRNFGRSKLPYNQDKSIAGSVAFFVMSSLVSMLYLGYFSAFGLLKILPGTVLGVVIVSLVTALVESLPISTRLDDNFTVPFTAIVLGMLVLPVS